jgi:hypothetical protein
MAEKCNAAGNNAVTNGDYEAAVKVSSPERFQIDASA